MRRLRGWLAATPREGEAAEHDPLDERRKPGLVSQVTDIGGHDVSAFDSPGERRPGPAEVGGLCGSDADQQHLLERRDVQHRQLRHVPGAVRRTAPVEQREQIDAEPVQQRRAPSTQAELAVVGADRDRDDLRLRHRQQGCRPQLDGRRASMPRRRL
jgi:hypothetical protein